MPNGEFKIYSGILKAHRGNDGRMRLHGVASSTIKDLHGDEMRLSALQDMEQAANQNLTIFLNHSYNVPEDVAGSVERASLASRDSFYDLDFDVVINDSNPRAVQAFEAIERGTKLGISIGAFIPEGGAKRDKNGSLVIEHIDLKEASMVGIPANPRSWVEYAVKSLNRAEAPSAEVDTAPGAIEATVSYIAAANCPSCGGSKGGKGCADSFHGKGIESTDLPVVAAETNELAAPVEPPETNATVSIQIDTDGSNAAAPASQEAPQSAPGNEGGLLDEDADGDDARVGDTVTRSLGEMLRETTSELVSVRASLAEALTLKDAAEKSRNAARAERDRVLVETKNLIDRLADTPLVRRAVVREATDDFSRFTSIYSEDFLKMLERKNG